MAFQIIRLNEITRRNGGYEMTTNKQMIQYAAKAAGYWNKEFDCYEGPFNFDPLTDSGDALRLAVALRLDIEHSHPAETTRWVMVRPQEKSTGVVEKFEDESSRLSATRRAIVRVAAGIGKGNCLHQLRQAVRDEIQRRLDAEPNPSRETPDGFKRLSSAAGEVK